MIWKQISNEILDRSLADSQVSKSRSKRYQPMRSSTVSDLHKNIKARWDTELNTSSVSLQRNQEDNEKQKMNENRLSPSKSEEQIMENLKKK